MKQAIDVNRFETATGKRAQKRISVQRAIRDAALDLFEEQGFDAVTTTDIARQAGVTQRTLFRYFATKEHLLFDGLDIDGWFAAAMNRHAAADPATRLRRGLEDMADAYDAHTATLRRVFGIISACPGLETAQSLLDRRIEAEMSAVIRAGYAVPIALAADVAAGAALGLMRPIIRAWLLGELAGPLRSYADRAWPTLEGAIEQALSFGSTISPPPVARTFGLRAPNA